MEVETYCPRCGLGGLHDEPWNFAVKSGSLAAARLRLADAAEAWLRAPETDHSREWDAMEEASFALALLRTKRAGNTPSGDANCVTSPKGENGAPE